MKGRGVCPMELRYDMRGSGVRTSLGSVTLKGATTIDAYTIVYILL